MKLGWIYGFIIAGGMLQAVGAPMNGALFASLQNKWLATAVSFIVVTFFFIVMFLIQPTPLPNARDLAHMPWWAPFGGIIGAVQVYAGLTLVQRVGAGPFMGLTVTAALLASLIIDHFGLFHMPTHPINLWRAAGLALMAYGVTLIARF
jgi:bacterial/archaeal transporter family-2 protein